MNQLIVKKVNNEMIMTKFEHLFAQHINNDFPPKYVFYADDLGEVGIVRVKKLSELEATHKCIGMTSNSINHKHLLAAGNLPILKRI